MKNMNYSNLFSLQNIITLLISTSYQLILNVKVLTQHYSSLVVYMFKISIMFEISFSVG